MRAVQHESLRCITPVLNAAANKKAAPKSGLLQSTALKKNQRE